MSDQTVINDKKSKKIINSIQSDINKIRNEFHIIRDDSQKSDFGSKEIAQKFNGTLRIENVEHTDSDETHMMKALRIYSKVNPKHIIYEAMYSGNGIIIKVGQNPYVRGIYYAKFSDFNCDNLLEVIYNQYKLTVIKSYNIKINNTGAMEGTFTVVDRPDKSFIGKLFSKNK